MEELDEHLIEAMKVPAKVRMAVWAEALEDHRRHETFRTEAWAFSRELGFTCSCSGEEVTYRLPLTSLREQLPQTRALFDRLRRRDLRLSDAAAAKANRVARALLFRYLTREQKWSFRASRSFDVVGQDGRTYRIKDGSCQNVFLVEDGCETVNYCIVSRGERVPNCDMMLAQKVMLESDIDSFMAIARWRETVPDRGWSDPGMPPTEVRPPPPLPSDEELENIAEWATARLSGAERNDDEHGHTQG